MSYDKQKKTQTVHISNTNMHECGATGGGVGETQHVDGSVGTPVPCMKLFRLSAMLLRLSVPHTVTADALQVVNFRTR